MPSRGLLKAYVSRFMVLGSLGFRDAETFGAAPNTVTVYNRATVRGIIYPHYEYYSTVTEWGGQYPT